MSDWQQLLRYVRGDREAKLLKDRFAALIEATDARIRELEQWKQAIIDGLDSAEIRTSAHWLDPKNALNDLIVWHQNVVLFGSKEPQRTEGGRMTSADKVVLPSAMYSVQVCEDSYYRIKARQDAEREELAREYGDVICITLEK